MLTIRSKFILTLAIIAIIVTGLVHVIDAPDAFQEAAYKGWLFALNGVGALVAAIGIYLRKRAWGWDLGLLIAVLSIVFYIFSRTVGLPYLPPEPDEWFEPLGVISLLAEGLFLAVYIIAAREERK
jgi:hypothetical protein